MKRQKTVFKNLGLVVLALPFLLLLQNCGKDPAKRIPSSHDSPTEKQALKNSLLPTMPEPLHKMPEEQKNFHNPIPHEMPEAHVKPIVQKKAPLIIHEEPVTRVAQPVIKNQVVKKATAKRTPTYDSNNPNELDFDVENTTGKTMYVCCFSYLRKRDFDHWHWEKSPVYKIDDNQIITIDIPTIPNEQDRDQVYGYLALLPNKKMADDATFELLEDRYKIDLDQLIKLKGKRVTLEVEQYGAKGQFFEYDFIKKSLTKTTEEEGKPRLDFAVENRTEKPVFVTCFVYEKRAKGSWIASEYEKDDMTVWHFVKTNIIKLMPDQIGLIDVGCIETPRDYDYVRGYLAVFDEDEEKEANASTFELLDTNHKLSLGLLKNLKNRKVVLEIEKYGIMEDIIDFTIKPVHKIDFTNIKKN